VVRFVRCAVTDPPRVFVARSNAHFRWWTKRTWCFSARSLRRAQTWLVSTLITVFLPLVVVEEAVVAVTPRCKKRAWLPRLKRPRPSNRRAVGASLAADSRKKPTPGTVQQNTLSTRPDCAKDFVALASAGACFGLRHEFYYARLPCFRGAVGCRIATDVVFSWLFPTDLVCGTSRTSGDVRLSPQSVCQSGLD
jgi:hypothetical protein